MLKKFAAKIWRSLPYNIRLTIARATQQKFTISVVAIVTNDNNEVLVMDHFFRPGSSWGLPGGFINFYESPEVAVRRELKEEADIQLEDLELLRVRSVGKHFEILFTAKAKGKARVNSGEIREMGWFSLDNLPEISEKQIQILKETLGE